MKLSNGKIKINGLEAGEIKEMHLETDDVSPFVKFRNGFSGQGTLRVSEDGSLLEEIIQVIAKYKKREKHRKRVKNRNKLYKKRKALGRIK